MPSGRGRLIVQTGHSGPVTAVTLSRDGGLVLTADSRGSVISWDTSGRELGRLHLRPGRIDALALSPDGLTILTGGLHDATDGRLLRWLGHRRDSSPDAVAFSPDGQQALTVDRIRGICVWNVVSGERAFSLGWLDRIDHEPAPEGAAVFSPDGSSLNVALADGTLRRFDCSSWRESGSFVLSEKPYGGVAFARDGQLLVMLAGASLFQVEVPSGRVRHCVDLGYERHARGLAVSDDGRFALVNDGTGLSVWDVPAGRQTADITTIERHEPRAASLYSPLFGRDPGGILVGESNHRASHWNAATGELLAEFGGVARPMDSAVFRRGKLVVTTGEGSYRESWDIATGSRLEAAPISFSESEDGSGGREARTTDGRTLRAALASSTNGILREIPSSSAMARTEVLASAEGSTGRPR